MSEYPEHMGHVEGWWLAIKRCPKRRFFGRHIPEPAAKRTGVFFCTKCGAVPKNSKWARI